MTVQVLGSNLSSPEEQTVLSELLNRLSRPLYFLTLILY